ncbi:MAG: hypothetical protein HRU80_05595 [Ignavibacteriales bacterium]|nr:MAG: hypothetical protein HRU80_05595 [Ignavibacteriales bacterium]
MKTSLIIVLILFTICIIIGIHGTLNLKSVTEKNGDIVLQYSDKASPELLLKVPGYAMLNRKVNTYVYKSFYIRVGLLVWFVLLLGMDYFEVNIFLFYLLFPIILIWFMLWILWLYRRIGKLQKQMAGDFTPNEESLLNKLKRKVGSK